MPLGFRDGKILFGAPNQLAVGNPCACCGLIECNFCAGGSASSTAVVTVSGIANSTTTFGCDINHDCPVLNGAYVLDSTTTPLCELSGCSWELPFEVWYCEQNAPEIARRGIWLLNLRVINSNTISLLMFVMDETVQGTVLRPCQVAFSWSVTSPEPIDCVGGSYNLAATSRDDLFKPCLVNSSNVNVTFGG